MDDTRAASEQQQEKESAMQLSEVAYWKQPSTYSVHLDMIEWKSNWRKPRSSGGSTFDASRFLPPMHRKLLGQINKALDALK